MNPRDIEEFIKQSITGDSNYRIHQLLDSLGAANGDIIYDAFVLHAIENSFRLMLAGELAKLRYQNRENKEGM